MALKTHYLCHALFKAINNKVKVNYIPAKKQPEALARIGMFKNNKEYSPFLIRYFVCVDSS